MDPELCSGESLKGEIHQNEQGSKRIRQQKPRGSGQTNLTRGVNQGGKLCTGY